MQPDVPFEVRGAGERLVTGYLRRIRSPRGACVLVYAPEEEAALPLSYRFEDLLPQLVKTHWLVVPFIYLEFQPIIGPEGTVFESFTRVHYLWEADGKHPLSPGVGYFHAKRREMLSRQCVETLLCQELAPLPHEKIRIR